MEARVDHQIEWKSHFSLLSFYAERIVERSTWHLHTLESGIDVAPWINVAPGTFGKCNKCSPLKKPSPSKITDNLIFYTFLAKEKKSKKRMKK